MEKIKEKGHDITTLRGNYKKGKVGAGGYLILNAFFQRLENIFSSLISEGRGEAPRDYSIQESASYRKYLSNQWEHYENVPSNWKEKTKQNINAV